MHGVPVTRLLVPLKEREFGDPEEVELILRDNIELSRDDRAERTESRKDDLVLIGADEHHVSLLESGERIDRLKLLGLHKLCK